MLVDYSDNCMRKMYGRAPYDWVGHGQNAPETHPYSFSAHYLWREFDKAKRPREIDGVYSDRMRSWDAASYARAREETGFSEMTAHMDRATAKRFVEIYYGGKFECVGYARDCNVSSGYPLGIFFIKDVE